MVFWKLLCSVWAYINDYRGCRWTFSWNVQEDFPKDLTGTGIFSCMRQPQYNYKRKVSSLLEKISENKISGQGHPSPMAARLIFKLCAWNAGLVDWNDIY